MWWSRQPRCTPPQSNSQRSSRPVPRWRCGRPRPRSTAEWTLTWRAGSALNPTCSPRCSPRLTALRGWARSSSADRAGPSSLAVDLPVTQPSAQPSASPAEIEAAWSDPKLANVLYHDWEAQTYDQKWSISFDQRCIDYARDRFEHIAGRERWPYRTALEVGCGTGFFILNLMLAGVIDTAPSTGHVTDVSPGMVEAARRNAESLGFQVAGRVADAERLPFDDATFELVVGHAVLHHIPDVEQALREVIRVLKPGGRFVFAGKPTKWGD